MIVKLLCKTFRISESKLTSPEFRIQSRVYIAEILYIQGDREGAKQWFEKILRERPHYRIDRFRHPPEVCGYFDFVKSYMKPIVAVEKKPTVKSTYSPFRLAPFGLYQLKKGQGVKGATHLVLQMGLGALSTGLYIDLLLDHSHLTGDETKRITLERKRLTQQISTALFYSILRISIYDTHSDIQIKLNVDPRDDGSLTGRF